MPYVDSSEIRDPHDGPHAWTMICGPVRDDFSWCERRRREVSAEKSLEEIDAKRVAAGVCRHCGGPVPCWSPFGDRAVGKRHTAKSLREARAD